MTTTSASAVVEMTGPLSLQQERSWRIPNAGEDVIPPLAIRLTGNLNRQVLENALAVISSRHAVFRTTFLSQGGSARQDVWTESRVDLREVDLSHLSSEERERETRRLIRVESNQPFLMDCAPLMRVRLVRFHETEHVLFFIVHHIISDLWSMKLLLNELMCLYGASVDGSQPAIRSLPIQYVDYARQQRAWLSGEVLQKQVDYLRRWAKELNDFILPMPSNPQDDGRRYGEVISAKLSPEISQELKTSSRVHRATVFTMVLALLQICLRNYFRQDRLLLGTIIANRRRTECEPLIGSFSSSLALRTDLSNCATLQDVVAQTYDQFFDAYANQRVALWQLSELTQQEWAPQLLRPRIACSLETTPLRTHQIPAATISDFACNGASIFEEGATAVAPFDQSWEIWDNGDSFSVIVVYRRGFKRSVVEDMLRSFEATVESVVRHPSTPIRM